MFTNSVLCQRGRFCIRSWLEHHSSCPTCRRSLVSKVDTDNQDTDEARGFPRVEIAPEGSFPTSSNASLIASRRGSSTATPSQSTAMSSTPTPMASHPSNLSGHSTPNTLASNNGSSSNSHHTATGTGNNRSSTGHQLFAFNSEQQPWLSRLGFPKITVEVVDQGQDEDESRIPTRRSQQQTPQNSSTQSSGRRSTYSSQSHRAGDEFSDDEDDDDLRRAIAESLAMSQQCQSQSTVSLISSSSTATTTSFETIVSAGDHDLQRRAV